MPVAAPISGGVHARPAPPDTRLYIDGVSKAFSYDKATDRLSHPTGRLSYGQHSVRIVTEDATGNVATRAWFFKVLKGR